MTHKEILEQTKSELDRLVSEAKRKLDDLVKPELKVGKWYKFDTPLFEYLLKYDGSDTAYGFADDTWSSSWSFSKNGNQELAKGKEATDQEVEDALVKEAKRRGLLYGVNIISPNGEDWGYKVTSNDFRFDQVNNTLYSTYNLGGTVFLFKDGKWAKPVEEGKFAELKKAHKNGAVIECLQSDGKWFEIEDPQWQAECEYRIKLEEPQHSEDLYEPKVGDVFIVKIKSDKDIDRLLKFESYDKV